MSPKAPKNINYSNINTALGPSGPSGPSQKILNILI